MLALVILIIASAFAMSKGDSMTGYSIFNPAKSYEIPVYVTTFIVLVVLLLFLILTIFTLDYHARGIKIKEDDKVGHIFKKY